MKEHSYSPTNRPIPPHRSFIHFVTFNLHVSFLLSLSYNHFCVKSDSLKFNDAPLCFCAFSNIIFCEIKAIQSILFFNFISIVQTKHFHSHHHKIFCHFKPILTIAMITLVRLQMNTFIDRSFY